MRVSAQPMFAGTMDGSGDNKYSTEPEQYYPDMPTQQSGGMEDTLLEHVQHDARLESGVPPEHQGSSLDSIMMSGLTSPEEIATVSVAPPTTHVAAPVSFYEKGVDDVDSSRGPDALEDTHHAEADLIIRAPKILIPDSSVADSFRDIIAQFSDETETDTSQTEPLVSGLDAPDSSELHDPVEDDPEDTTDEIVPEPEPDPIEEEVFDASDVTEVLPEATTIEEEPVEPNETPDTETSVTEVAAAVPVIEPVPDIADALATDNSESLVEIAPPFPDTEPAPLDDQVTDEPSPATTEPEQKIATSVPQASASSPESPALAKAESLMRRLVAEDRATTSTAPPSLLQDWTFPERAEEDVVEEDETTAAGRRRSSGQRSARRRLIRWTLRLALLAIVVGGGYQGYSAYRVAMATDVELFNRASAQLEQGNYTEGSALFLSLPERYPASPLSSDAQFMGAYALTLVPVISGDAPQAYADAIIRLQQFIGNNPDHPKVHRAETLLGITYYRTQDFERTIAVLRDPRLRKYDREAYLPSLRILARAHAAVNDVDRAHTTYLRAASLEENASPDQDYLELAAMYERRAQHADTSGLRLRYLRAAVDHWDIALQVPGLLKTRKKDIRKRRDIAAEQLGGGLIADDGTRMPTLFEQSTTKKSAQDERYQQAEEQLQYID